jgi:arabinogalactan endo-1,4-beta-galactosidase
MSQMRKIFFTILIFNSLIYSQSIGFINGVDISMLYQIEENNGIYFENGIAIDPIDIFKQHGVNTIRLKIWHTPDPEFNSLQNVLQMAQRIDSIGLDIMLNFHYSDTWADPSHQTKPSAWESIDFETLADSIYDYTNHVITRLKTQGTLPKFVQIGNETDCGLLWPDGYICDESNTAEQWLNLGILYNNAISGIQDAIDEMDTVWTLGHLSHGGLWYFSNLFNEGVSLDIIGQSYYPWWHGSLDELSTNLTQLSNEFQKPIVIVETAYPFTLSWNDNTNNIIGMESQLLDGFPASEIGQLNFLQAVKDRVTNNEFGAGICYWSPEWISTETFGSPWENLALFDFNSEVLDGITVFENDNTGIDENINPEHIKLKLFPNPFNPITNIHYEIQRSGFVEIMIYNINGELVESIVKQDQHKGEHSVLWNSEGLSSGVYFYQLKLNGEVLGTKQAVLIK